MAPSNYLAVPYDLIDHSLSLEVFPVFLRHYSFPVVKVSFCCYAKVIIPKCQRLTTIKVFL